jgi:hypothetical protein
MQSMPRILLVFLIVLSVSFPAYALGGWLSNRDDCAPCTRHAYAEYGAEHCRSKHLAHLDCRGLAAYAEHWRLTANQRIAAAYNRQLTPAAAPVLAPATTPEPAPSATPETPAAPVPPNAPEPALPR